MRGTCQKGTQRECGGKKKVCFYRKPVLDQTRMSRSPALASSHGLPSCLLCLRQILSAVCLPHSGPGAVGSQLGCDDLGSLRSKVGLA